MGGNKRGGTSRQSRRDKAHARAMAAAAAKAEQAAAAAAEKSDDAESDAGLYEEVDGSMLEGGGQVVRGGCALAALLGRPVRITHIRAGRERPGLKRQHVAGLQLLGTLYGAGALRGVVPGSSTITFAPTTFAWPPVPATPEPAPGQPEPGEPLSPLVLEVDVGTAGSVALVMQTAVPVLLAHAGTLAGRDVVLRVVGGTHVAMAPPVTYLAECLVPRLRAMGAACTVAVERYGLYPRGGGCATVRVGGLRAPLAPLVDAARAPVVRYDVRVFFAGVRADVGARAADAAVAVLRARGGVAARAVACTVRDVGAACAGEGMWIEAYATTARGQVLGASSIGRRGVRAEAVAAEAVAHLLADVAQGGAVDEYLQDQLLVFMAMARGRSVLRAGRLSLHTQTMVALINQLAHAPVLTTAPATDGEPGTLILCDGLGIC